MSVGNLKDYGNKGNNFPYQLQSLKGLDCACNELSEINTKNTFSNLTISTFTDVTALGLAAQIQALFVSNTNSQLISQNIVYDGVGFVAFIIHTI